MLGKNLFHNDKMTIFLSKQERRELSNSSKISRNTRMAQNISNFSKYTIPFSHFKMDMRSTENSRIKNLEKISQFSDEFKNILRKELS